MSMRIIHYFMMYIFICFMLIHIYLANIEGISDAAHVLLERARRSGVRPRRSTPSWARTTAIWRKGVSFQLRLFDRKDPGNQLQIFTSGVGGESRARGVEGRGFDAPGDFVCQIPSPSPTRAQDEGGLLASPCSRSTNLTKAPAWASRRCRGFQLEALLVGLRGDMGMHRRLVHHVRVEEAQHAHELILSMSGAAHADARASATGFSASPALGGAYGARQPVQEVLQRSGDRVVVLGAEQPQAVCSRTASRTRVTASGRDARYPGS